MIELDMESKGIQCVSPLQIIMSNGRYYVIVKNERKFQTQEFLFYRIDLMDEIENENLYKILSKEDDVTLKILVYKIQGYSTKEIANILGITIDNIYYRIKN